MAQFGLKDSMGERNSNKKRLGALLRYSDALDGFDIARAIG
jgi:hypothetical protein